jgi:hypothetical protein
MGTVSWAITCARCRAKPPSGIAGGCEAQRFLTVLRALGKIDRLDLSLFTWRRALPLVIDSRPVLKRAKRIKRRA